MPTNHLVRHMEHFLEQGTASALTLRFDQLDIFSFNQGRLLDVHSRDHGHVVLSKHIGDLPKIQVMDQFVFSFSFNFSKFGKSKMLNLPRPLCNGHLKMDNDHFALHFTIDAPKNDLQVQLCYVYRSFCSGFF